MNRDAIAFEGEVQLLRWSETSNQGATVTLQLSDATDLERFKTMTLAKGKQAGQRLAAVMVEIGDNEQPVEQVKPTEQKERAGMLCIMACNFCDDASFQRWIHTTQEWVCESAADAKEFILTVCSIESRKELDHKTAASITFHTEIRQPFLEWKGRQ